MRIGSIELKNGLCLAPMSGITDSPYRRIAKRYGCGLVITGLISSEGLLRRKRGFSALLGHHPDEKPLGFQLFGSSPNTLSEAAKMVQDQGADLVDINMGCPAPKVVEKGGGAALLRDPQRVFDILKAVRSALTIPLTIKMRAGWSQAEANYLEIGRIAEDCGVDGVFFHPRFRIQGFSGNADWAMIGRLKAILRTPVIGNGDVASPADAEQMLKVTGCDGIMIGRASRGSPWIFSRIQAVLEQEGVIEAPSLAERKAALEQHLGHIMEANDGRNRIVVLRMQAYWYTKGLPLSRYFHDRLKEARESRQLNEMIDRYFESIEMRSEGRKGRRAGDSQQ